LTTKSNYFEGALAFSPAMEGVCSAQVQAQNKHSGGEGEMNKRKLGSFALCALLFVLSVSAEAQQPKKIPRIGYLSSSDPVTESARAEATRLALRELGHIEGQNIATEYRYAEGKIDRFSELAAELVRLKVDIIVVAGGTIYVQAAKNATKTIPIVMSGGGSDPVEAGLIESLARPGGNVTGLSLLSRELGGKRLELLKEAVPKLVRVAVLYNPAASGGVREVKEVLPVAARALRLTIRFWEVRATDSFDKVIGALNKERPDGLYVSPGPLMRDNQTRIVAFALKRRLPSVYGNREAADAGGLMSYGADLVDNYRRVAYFVDKILKGAKPADLPVEQPTKFELVINLKTAKQIGLTIPQSLLYRADRVIK
jgi:putative tryptophan/tyrosine transport system substrate-binding protein